MWLKVLPACCTPFLVMKTHGECLVLAYSVGALHRAKMGEE